MPPTFARVPGCTKFGVVKKPWSPERCNRVLQKDNTNAAAGPVAGTGRWLFHLNQASLFWGRSFQVGGCLVLAARAGQQIRTSFMPHS